jgi:alpha-glucuronidase
VRRWYEKRRGHCFETQGKILEAPPPSDIVWESCCSPAQPSACCAETGEDAWLRYAPLDASRRRKIRVASSERDRYSADSAVLLATAQRRIDSRRKGNARKNSSRGKRRAIGERFRSWHARRNPRPPRRRLHSHGDLRGDGFLLTTGRVHGFACTIIAGADERGALYGVFAFLSKIARNQNVADAERSRTTCGSVALGERMGQSGWQH